MEIDEGGGGDEAARASGARPKQHRKKVYDLNSTDGFWLAQKGRFVQLSGTVTDVRPQRTFHVSMNRNIAVVVLCCLIL